MCEKVTAQFCSESVPITVAVGYYVLLLFQLFDTHEADG
jgi:hypothetical protein